jgi:hypothetical protein
MPNLAFFKYICMSPKFFTLVSAIQHLRLILRACLFHIYNDSCIKRVVQQRKAARFLIFCNIPSGQLLNTWQGLLRQAVASHENPKNTQVMYGQENAGKAIAQFCADARSSFCCCIDSAGPSFTLHYPFDRSW